MVLTRPMIQSVRREEGAMGTAIRSYQDPRLRRVDFAVPCADGGDGIDAAYATLLEAGAEYVFGLRWEGGEPGRWRGYVKTVNPLAFREAAARLLPGIALPDGPSRDLSEMEAAYQRGYNSGYQAGRRAADAALARWGTARAEIRRLRGRQGHRPTLAESPAARERRTELEVEEFSALAALKELADVAALDAAHVAARQGPAGEGEDR